MGMAANTSHHVHNHNLVTDVTFYLNIIGVLLSIISIPCFMSISRRRCAGSFKDTLISYTFVNILTSAYIIFSTCVIKFQIAFELDFSFLLGLNCSVLLSVAHLVCLSIAEYVIISSRLTNETKRFTGLIAMCWILGASGCSLLFNVSVGTLQLVIPIVLFTGIIGMAFVYCCLMSKYRYRKRKIDFYKMRNERGIKKKLRGKNMIFPRLIIVLFFLSSLPMGCIQLYYRTKGILHEEDEMGFEMILIYSLHFIYVAVICICVKIRSSKDNFFSIN